MLNSYNIMHYILVTATQNLTYNVGKTNIVLQGTLKNIHCATMVYLPLRLREDTLIAEMQI